MMNRVKIYQKNCFKIILKEGIDVLLIHIYHCFFCELKKTSVKGKLFYISMILVSIREELYPIPLARHKDILKKSMCSALEKDQISLPRTFVVGENQFLNPFIKMVLSRHEDEVTFFQQKRMCYFLCSVPGSIFGQRVSITE